MLGLERLIVGRDVVERRGYSAIIVQSFLVGVLGMLDSALGALNQVDRELRHDAPDRLTVTFE